MKNHGKKFVAPIVITVLVILYYFVYFGILIHLTGGVGAVFLGIIPLILAGCMVYVCVERIKEIKGGEEDDISKY
ncbi:MAG: hypothetical protein J1E62_08175 [Lachnospiraceae bacterium]|nr:hypothetical protein [Lachnospiraceae bacterium]